MTEHKRTPITYSQAGVDIERGAELVEQIKPAVKKTYRTGVASDIGGFGGLFSLKECGYRDPVLVSATDGVGTKLKLAIDSARHTTVGIDLVAMCVNDIIVQGAEPLFFLDYFASSTLDVAVAREVIEGIARGCEIAGAALLGGETAEMPDMYRAGDYDLAGFCVGAVERDAIIDGTAVGPGDAVIGLTSSGIHSNGYSLVRRIIAENAIALDMPFESQELIDVLLAPTRIYVKPLLATRTECAIHALAHITGGGISENLPRVLPPGLIANIDLSAWRLPPIFSWLAHTGPIDTVELLRTFNCGIGMIGVVPADQAQAFITLLNGHGESAILIGEISADDGEPVRYSGDLR